MFITCDPLPPPDKVTPRCLCELECMTFDDLNIGMTLVGFKRLDTRRDFALAALKLRSQ